MQRYEKLTEIMMDLTVENKILKKVVESRRLHYNNLKAFNLKCKERLSELTLKGEESNLNPSRSMTLMKEVIEFMGTYPASQEEQQGPIKIVHHTPLFIDKTMHVSKVLGNGQSPKSPTKSAILENGQHPKSPTKTRNSSGLEPHIPDLNDVPEEGIGMTKTEHFLAFSLNKTVVAAEARRIRIGILRLKKADKPR